MPCRGGVWEFGSRASNGEIKKANIPHASAHFMRQDVVQHSAFPKNNSYYL